MPLHINELTYRYRKHLPPALNNVSLRIPTGAVVAVVGMSGSGKTTLLSILGLLVEGKRRPKEVVWEDGSERHDYADLGWSRRAEFRRRHFGFVFQSAYLLPYFSNKQNIQLPLALERIPRGQRNRALVMLLRAIGQAKKELRGQMSKPPRRVAGGQRQRMAILRAVIHDPQIVFADEPFANLDPLNRTLIVRLVKDWQGGILNPRGKKQERTLLVITHDIGTAWNDFAQYFVLLRNGQVIDGHLFRKKDLPGGPEEIERLISPNSQARL